MKNWRKPTPEEVDRIVARLGRLSHRRYFFTRLANPEWIQPLRERDQFSSPSWPESFYLAKVAAGDPSAVREVLGAWNEIADSRVREDFLDATLAMPPSVSATLESKLILLAETQDQFLAAKLGALVVHLAKGGRVVAALAIAKVVLEPQPDPDAYAKIERAEAHSAFLLPKTRFDFWQYQQILEKNIPDLVTATGIKALDLLCDLLESAIRLSSSREREGSPDYSQIWRRAVEEHEQNQVPSLTSQLVATVRDAAERIVDNSLETVENVVQALHKRSPDIFTRIALHVLRRFSEKAPNLVAEFILRRVLFDDSECRHEYCLLLGANFGKLSKGQREEILSWIEKGPDLQALQERRKLTLGEESSDKDLERYADSWRLTRLAWIESDLSESWKPIYDKLQQKLGKPEHPDFSSYMTTSWGTQSPLSAEDLKSKSVPEIVQVLREWEPPNQFMGASPEGLRERLSASVAEEPSRFVAELNSFKGLKPTYLRGLIWGLREALGKKLSFDWRVVLEFCTWILTQTDEVAAAPQVSPVPYKEEDPDWSWTRKAIADLLGATLSQNPVAIPLDLQKNLWAVLRTLCNDPDPTPEHEGRYGGSNMDPSNLSINTTRGEAMHAVIRYALWVRRTIDPNPEPRPGKSWFAELDEVREVLDEHLDPAKDPSYAIRSVYGQWFPWLLSLDQAWTKQNVPRIFPADEGRRKFWEAAWGAYISFCEPYGDVFAALIAQYTLAVERLPDDSALGQNADHISGRLAQHLMSLYWWARLQLEDSLFRDFWLNAAVKTRAAALATLGRWLLGPKETVSEEVIQRLKRLWEWRLEEARKAVDKTGFAKEIAAFGSWFASGKFDDTWAIAQFENVLELSGRIEINHQFMEQLARIGLAMPAEAVRVLARIAAGDQGTWQVTMYYKDQSRQILSAAMAAGGPASAIASKLINELGSRGYYDFRDLLTAA
jgi:hypothetical protein